MKLTVSKSLAAIHQLDVAVELLFADRNSLAVRTLAAAAFGLLSDLVEIKSHGSSWRETLISDSGLPKKQALVILHAANNFLKHADRDPDENLIFDEEENDYVIFFATLECGELKHPLSHTMQAFQIWYVACHREQFGPVTDLLRTATSALPGLYLQDRQTQLKRGKEFMKEVLVQYSGLA